MSCSLIGKTLLFGGSYCKFESCQLNNIFVGQANNIFVGQANNLYKI